jgi:hypothetical protein
MRRIQSIIGVAPTRSELVAIYESLRWGRASREEKRVRATLVTRIESMAGKILGFLETEEGVRALTVAYLRARDGHQREATAASAKQSRFPRPELGIAFYLNDH